MTVLLTSHYMKDVVALCRRVVVIALGRIIYDGSLSGIVDRFAGHKIVSLQLADAQVPQDLGQYGEVIEAEPPRARLRVRPEAVTDVLGRLLWSYPIAGYSFHAMVAYYLLTLVSRAFSGMPELARRADAGRLRRLARAGLPAGVLHRGHAGDDRLLVP